MKRHEASRCSRPEKGVEVLGFGFTVDLAFLPGQKERNEISPRSPRARYCKPHDHNTCPSDPPSLESDRASFSVGAPKTIPAAGAGGGEEQEGRGTIPMSTSGSRSLYAELPVSHQLKAFHGAQRVATPLSYERVRDSPPPPDVVTHGFQAPGTMAALGTPLVPASGTSITEPILKAHQCILNGCGWTCF